MTAPALHARLQSPEERNTVNPDYSTMIHLMDADDSIELILADGSVLTVTGDGIIALFLDTDEDTPTSVVNIYVPDADGKEYYH